MYRTSQYRKEVIRNIVLDKSYLTIISAIILLNSKGFKRHGTSKNTEPIATLLLCFYVVFVFSINPFMTNFPGMSFEVTDQNNEGVFSSLSRNFDQTVEKINNADEKSTTSSSTSPSSSQPTPLTMLMKKALPPPQPPPPPQPTPLTMLMKKALLLMSQLRLSSLLILLAAIRHTDDLEKNNETGFIK